MMYTGTLTKTPEGYPWTLKDVFDWEIGGRATLTSTAPITFALTDTSHKIPALIYTGELKKDGDAYTFTLRNAAGWSIAGEGKVAQKSPLIMEMSGEVGPIPKAFHIAAVDDAEFMVA